MSETAAITQPRRVLVVDDDAVVLDLIQRLLSRHHEVVSSTEATETILRKSPFDVVVADYFMPQLNGVEFLNLVRRVRPQAVRILMSGSSRLPRRVEQTEGLHGLLPKPFTSSSLSSVINQALATMPANSKASPTVLIVDDSQLDIEATKFILEDAGYHGIGLSNPFKLIETIREVKPAAILLDVHMPALDGTRLVGVMRQFDFVGGAKIILHSSSAEGQLRKQTQSSGADGFLQKSADWRAYEQCFADLGLEPGPTVEERTAGALH